MDIRGLVDQLVAAEGSPKTARFDRKEAELTAKLSSAGVLKGALSDFQSSLSALKYSYFLAVYNLWCNGKCWSSIRHLFPGSL
jgi:flagellar capping protein FliD